MKKSILYPLVVAVIVGVCALFIKAFKLNFEGVFTDYTLEIVLLIVVLFFIAAFICREVYLFLLKKKKLEVNQLIKEKDSYKSSLDELVKVDEETRRLRAIIKYKHDNSAK